LFRQDDIQALLEDLNPRQRQAVTHGPGPLLIIAGAGTGKTKVLTHRIAYLIASKMAEPEEIMAVTFTEKAANEMEERVDRLIPYSYSFVEISTFNSFGERVLRNYALELGYPLDFHLLDEVEQAIFFREHLFDLPLRIFRPPSSPARYIQEMLEAIRRLKQEDIAPGEYRAWARRRLREARPASAAPPPKSLRGKEDPGPGQLEEMARKHLEVALVFGKYHRLLRQKGLIDFEDQLALAVELFRSRPSVLDEFRNKFKYILVDEFQDTNHIQFELLKMLAARHRNLTVVGDDDQSIFRFRGASLSNILNFQSAYPDCRKVILTTNYRSNQAILDASYRLIRLNSERLEFKQGLDKKLEATVPGQPRSLFLEAFDTVSHEADRVADIILERHKEGFGYGDMAILVRRNADADPFLKALNMKEIPYRFSGSRGLYAQEEIKLLISFLRSLTDFEDGRSLYYLALSPLYRVPAYDLIQISTLASKKHIPLHRLFKQIAEGSSPVEISEEAAAAVRRLFQDLLHYVNEAARRNAGQLLFDFLQRSGFLKSLLEERSLRAEAMVKNIRIFFDKIKNFSDLAEDDSVQPFVRHLGLLQEMGDNPSTAEAELDEEAVNVLTVHKAKGLEFSAVFMVSLVADRFPARERREKIPFPDELLKEPLPPGENTLQEERRLFYVGMTRAKHFLYLTWARDYGLKRQKKISPFVLDALDILKMPEETRKSPAEEEIRRVAQGTLQPGVFPAFKPADVLTLSFFQVDDYLTCPLRYKYRHILRIPVLAGHNLVFGRVLHNAVHYYLKKKMSGQPPAVEELVAEYGRLWVNEGYLSREHEELRRQAGERALRMFWRREEAAGRPPDRLEADFRWQEGTVRFIGRWDRLDLADGGAVITDFKAAEVKDQKEADHRAAESLQLDLYALSFEKTEGKPLAEVRLHYLESDIVGRAAKAEREKQRARDRISETEDGLRGQDFTARPDWHNCSYCDFKGICPSSYAY
jgi:DNA helicase-2/ATP-dependent DNA helicase PcrA